MRGIVNAIRYRNLDEARDALRTVRGGPPPRDPFDDDGAEPEGLLSVITEDLVGGEIFYKLLDAQRGTLLEVVRKPYSGFGPPAEEENYMGFPAREVCYVMLGTELAIEIEECPNGARDIHHLEALVMDGLHPLDRQDLAGRLELPVDWSFEDLFDQIASGSTTADQIDTLIHRAVH